MESAARQLQPRVVLRAGEPGDHPFVYETWLRHYRRHGPVQHIPEQTYRVEQRELIKSILARSTLSCVVDAEIPSLVLGYVVSSERAVHWLHVKAIARGCGVARALAQSVPDALYYTHAVPIVDVLFRRCGLSLTYNPHRAWAL